MELTSVKTIKQIKERFGFEFKKGLGQNFLTDKSVLEKIAFAAEPGEGVLEIGPGFGVLTKELAENFEKVVSVEIDSRLIDILDYTLSDCDNVCIVNEDILKCDINKLIGEQFDGKTISIAANLPYYITTPVITTLLERRLNVSCIVVMIQKEVALRLCAKPGTKDYGAISVLCGYYTEPEIVTTVSAGAFVPPPKVDSAVVKMKIRKEPAVKTADSAMFFKTVKAAFSQRRKTLLNCINSAFPYGKEVLAEKLSGIGIDPKRRGETLSLEEFAELSDMLFYMSKQGD